jgi:hypothetical protein
MPEKIRFARSGWFWTFVLISSLLFPTLNVGAQQATPVPTPTPQPTPVPELKMKVKVVEVTISGKTLQVNPEKVRLRRREEVVNWVTNGTSMTIAFKPGNPAPGNPFTDLTCKGRFCGALTPPDVAPGVYNYTVTVDGVVLDPNVEVIP